MQWQPLQQEQKQDNPRAAAPLPPSPPRRRFPAAAHSPTIDCVLFAASRQMTICAPKIFRFEPLLLTNKNAALRVMGFIYEDKIYTYL